MKKICKTIVTALILTLMTVSVSQISFARSDSFNQINTKIVSAIGETELCFDGTRTKINEPIDKSSNEIDEVKDKKENKIGILDFLSRFKSSMKKGQESVRGK